MLLDFIEDGLCAGRLPKRLVSFDLDGARFEATRPDRRARGATAAAVDPESKAAKPRLAQAHPFRPSSLGSERKKRDGLQFHIYVSLSECVREERESPVRAVKNSGVGDVVKGGVFLQSGGGARACVSNPSHVVSWGGPAHTLWRSIVKMGGGAGGNGGRRRVGRESCAWGRKKVKGG